MLFDLVFFENAGLRFGVVFDMEACCFVSCRRFEAGVRRMSFHTSKTTPTLRPPIILRK